MMKPLILKFAGGLLLLASAASFHACEQQAAERPNILFIFSDDHAYQAISAYGYEIGKFAPTPNIDRIAAEGMRFDRCFVTNSICAPSRATILTGKHSHLNSVPTNRERFDSTQMTFPRILQESGYQTAIVGKWHLKTTPMGFDFWQVLPGQGHYYNPDFRTAQGTIRVKGYVTEIVTDKALEWLQEKRDKTKPFMLMLQHKAPHRRWEPGPGQLGMFDDVTFPEPENLFDDYEGRGTAAREQDMTIDNTMRLGGDLKVWPDQDDPGRERFTRRFEDDQRRLWAEKYDPVREEYLEAGLRGKELVSWKYQRYMRDYLACIQSVDENVGRMLDYLEESGLAENTVVIYNSDQGFYLGEHGWFDKRFMYEESLRTPLVVRWPGVTGSGKVNDELVSNLDFAQTFLEIGGVEAPDDMQGKSLVPLLQGNTPGDWRKSLYYHYYEFPGAHSVRKHEGIATKEYKLMHFYNLDEWELYDLANDPREMRSVYDDPAFEKVILQLKKELDSLKILYDVPVPVQQ
jgi:arylsulfatase A-like enzyme